MSIKETLIENDGYVILEDIIPHNLLDTFNSKIDKLYPVRASSSGKKYAEREDIKTLLDISVWWSQLVMDWPEVIEMNDIITTKVKEAIPNAHWYASDTVFIEPQSTWLNPHVDTPHRFEKYTKDKRLLGVQCITPLFDLDYVNGATGLVPKSQLKDFPIDLCYKGYYNGYFIRNFVQPKVNKGSVLVYNCRILHSSMPNPTDIKRPAILMNYIDSDIIDELKTIDNIWNSNGK
jgi:ectoine hydroxylase-related dioxygenase (phytanoyl-CoA dioxygenase family)